MDKSLKLQRLLFLNENKINPFCYKCKLELSGYLISQEELTSFFSPEDIGWLIQKKQLQQSLNYIPKLIIYLCRGCCKGERTI